MAIAAPTANQYQSTFSSSTNVELMSSDELRKVVVNKTQGMETKLPGDQPQMLLAEEGFLAQGSA